MTEVLDDKLALIQDLLDTTAIVTAHQEAFETLYDLARNQQTEIGKELDPELFALIETAIKPVFLAWREKYDQLRGSIDRQKNLWKPRYQDLMGLVVYLKILDGPEISANHWTDNRDLMLADYPLRISQQPPQAAISSQPILRENNRQHWNEHFNFSEVHFTGTKFRLTQFKIREQSGSLFTRDRLTKDSLNIEGTETEYPINQRQRDLNPIYSQVGRTFILSVIQNSPRNAPAERRLRGLLNYGTTT